MGMCGIIFDLDGVLCYTDHYHYLAWKAVADRLSLPFDEQVNNRLRGVSRMESLEIILSLGSKTYSQEEKEQIAAEKNPQQPVLPVLLALKAVSLLVELEQDGLGHVLRVRPVLQSVVSNPVEHVPVGAGHPLECLVCHGYSLPCGRLLKGLSLRIPAGGGKYLRPGKKRGRNFPLGKSAPGLTGPDAGRP